MARKGDFTFFKRGGFFLKVKIGKFLVHLQLGRFTGSSYDLIHVYDL